MEQPHSQNPRQLYTVSKLTKEIKVLLENKFPFIWISGEISNLTIPASGHLYFTLKDKTAQIGAVMFRGQRRQLKFDVADGMQIIGLGRISVYEPRGTYQVIFEYLEPKGVGALQFAFEQLKARLAEEGLFDVSHKKALPFLPEKIALITSPTGAVVHDMLQVLSRRFPGMRIVIIPVKVQGEGAVEELVAAIRLLNDIKHIDVAIIARGGGSIEDLQAFNDESVARAIFAATVPIVSAVGHETDFTIADFVADMRAPTPSVAAELVVPLKHELIRRVETLSHRLPRFSHQHLSHLRFQVAQMDRRLIHPAKKLQDLQLRLDELVGRLTRNVQGVHRLNLERLVRRIEALQSNTPSVRVARNRDKLRQMEGRLLLGRHYYVNGKKSAFQKLIAKLQALSPLAILSRGYSITRTVPEGRVVKDAGEVRAGRELEIIVEKGAFRVSVVTPMPAWPDREEGHPNGNPNV